MPELTHTKVTSPPLSFRPQGLFIDRANGR